MPSFQPYLSGLALAIGLAAGATAPFASAQTAARTAPVADTGKPAEPARQRKAGKGKKASSGVRLVKPPRSTYANGQTETQRKRSEQQRLRRECRGRPNAGACRGYTD